MRTRKAYRTTIYEAAIAQNVLDQNDNVLVPKASPAALVVRSIPYLRFRILVPEAQA
ncbi:MAG TPA: hypothetical protein VME17_04765 [Bryobacteraceae bacterium]|nr:hypothetical protein [Bryobacteraceae bacterium]